MFDRSSYWEPPFLLMLWLWTIPLHWILFMCTIPGLVEPLILIISWTIDVTTMRYLMQT